MKIGSSILEFDRLESTNQMMREMLQEGHLQQGAVIRSSFQTKGRGQRGTHWESQSESNLLFSVLLNSEFIPPEGQFAISQMASLAIRKAIQELVGDALVQIKWPNDILLDGKKLCGLLIENSIKGSKLEWTILGIGLNVNQVDFEDLAKANSLSKHSDKEFNLKEVFALCLEKLDLFWNRLSNGESLEEEYLACLYGFNMSVPAVISGKNLQVLVWGVDAQGKLLAEVEGKLRSFDLKEIQFNSIVS